MKKADTYFVVVPSEQLKKGGGGTEKNPSRGCFGLVGPGHVRHEARDDAAEALAKAMRYQD